MTEYRQGLLFGFSMVLIGALVMMPSAEVWAQDPGDIVQIAANSQGKDEAPAGLARTTVEFDSQPEEGNLLIALSGHRVDWLDAEMISDGWTLAVLRNDEEYDTQSRRGLAMWYRTAGPNESTQVTTQWSNSADNNSHSDRHNMTMVKEIHGTFPILDVTATNSSFDASVESVSTGTTPVSTGAEKVVVGAMLSRGIGSPASWTNGLDDNRRVTSDGDEGYSDDWNEDWGAPWDFTIQSARKYEDKTGSWESRAHWENVGGSGGIGAAFGVIAVFSNAHAGDYYFGPHCSPATVHEPETTDPAAYITLDKSGSMEGNFGTCSTDCAGGGTTCNLWEIAECSLDVSLASMENDLMVGFGFFPHGTRSGAPSRYSHEDCNSSPCLATYDVTANYGTRDDILDAIAGETSELGGYGTPTTDGLVVSRDIIENSSHNKAGILITDGYPEDSSDSIDAACDSRQAGITQYIVGLGGDTDEEFNNVLAAAAGTGCCGDDAGPGCPAGVGDDPCTSSVTASSCHGSRQANTEEEFQELLSDIGREIECTFSVEDDHWQGEIPDDPGVARIQLWSDNEGIWIEIPHVSFVGGSGDYEACPNTEEFCTRGGRCVPVESNYGCERDHHCDDPGLICHEKLGCIPEEESCDGGCEPDEFCWHGTCVPDTHACDNHGDCDSHPGHYACHDGYCRDSSEGGWCPHEDAHVVGDGSWACEDFENEFCHPVAGCLDRDEYFCDADNPCPSGQYCWSNMCVDEAGNSDRCMAGALGGWEFANTSRNQITLTGQYCSNLGSGGGDGEYTEVQTQLACTCYSWYEGEDCPISANPGDKIPGGCPAGLYVCNSDDPDDRECDASLGAGDGGAANPDDCPFHCDEDIDGFVCDPDCEVTFDYISGIVFAVCDEEVVELSELSVETSNRCEVAETYCDEGIPTCQEGALRPMPEVCDGLDNSCDGKINNIEESWEHWRNCTGPWAGETYCGLEFEDHPNPADVYDGSACFEQDHNCVCPSSNPAGHVGTGETGQDEFYDYLESFTPADGCECRAQ